MGGPPIAGFVVEATGDKHISFYISTTLLGISAVICFTAWLAQKRISRSAGPAAEMKTACCHCMLSLQAVTASCDCMLSLKAVTASCDCMPGLHARISCCDCMFEQQAR